MTDPNLVTSRPPATTLDDTLQFYAIKDDGSADYKVAISLLLSARWNIQTDVVYTIQASDNGKNLGFTNAGPVAVTLPDTLPVDFDCSIFQLGAGTVTVTPDTDTINGAGSGVSPSARWKALYLTQFLDTEWLAVL